MKTARRVTSVSRARFTAAKVPRVSCPNAGQRLNAGCAWVYGRPWGSWAAAEFGWDWVESLDVKKATLAACRAGVGKVVRGQLVFPQCVLDRTADARARLNRKPILLLLFELQSGSFLRGGPLGRGLRSEYRVVVIVGTYVWSNSIYLTTFW